MDISVGDKGLLTFGRFRLDPQRRVLWHDGGAVKLTPKAFDTLCHLVTNAGRLVEKDELLSAVWGTRIVEEGNLSQTIFSIRKALQCEAGADRWIVTAPGRGYRFTAEVHRDSGAAQPAAAALSTSEPEPYSPGSPSESRHLPPRWFARAGFAVALTAAGAIAWLAIRQSSGIDEAAGGPPPYSVAVLPFENMSGDPTQDYISDGLADELINTLSRIDALQVAARTSAFSFKGSHATIADIARKLNVAAVLEGSVSREGGQVRLNVQLINAATGFPFWSRSYGGGLGDMLASQADTARTVANTLRVKLLGEDLPRLVSGGTHNPQALDAYLRGMKHVRADDPSAALGEFEAAIALDPHYALARTLRSQTLRQIVNTADDGDAGRVVRLEAESLAEARRAVEQAPDLGVAHTDLGIALEEGQFDFVRAAAEIARGRDLAPSNAHVLGTYAELQSHLGHTDEAIEADLQATKLDPLSPSRYRALSSTLAFARRYKEALQAARHVIAVRGRATSYDTYGIGEIQYLQNQREAALATCSIGKAWPLQHCLALAYAKLGRRKEADEALAHVRAALGDAGAMQYATIYAQWGQPDQAIPWLETAYRLHDPGLIEMQVLPLLDPIRGTPAFRDIQRRMNFSP